MIIGFEERRRRQSGEDSLDSRKLKIVQNNFRGNGNGTVTEKRHFYRSSEPNRRFRRSRENDGQYREMKWHRILLLKDW